ncbi:MAG: hypothetical protein V7709_01475 [Halioglobus sp.]
MNQAQKIICFFRDGDWRISFGLVISVIWLTGGAWYMLGVGDGSSDMGFSRDSMGSFLEGVFAPLAFLWLVLGLFVQQRELANNTKALHRTSEQSAMQTHSIAATEMNARQETFFKIAESVKHQLGGISGMLYVSSQGPVGSGKITRDQMDESFSRASRGDSELFARLFVSSDFLEEGGLSEVLYATELRQRHCDNYIRTFERLRKLAQNCDIEGIIEDSLMQSALGLLYLRMVEYHPNS